MSEKNTSVIEVYSSGAKGDKSYLEEPTIGFKQNGIIEVRDVDEDDDEFHDDASSLFQLDDQKLRRGLNQRHLQMIALVGVFGTGLFLGSGGALAKTGPAGILISYIVIGLVVGFNQLAIAEVATLAPLTGSTIRHSEIFVDQAVGFAFGWLNVWSAIMPTALVSAALVIEYWSDLSPAVWITVLIVPILLTNCVSIRIYGEMEFFFAILKILLILGMILMSLCLDLGGVKGQERLGFHYWRDPGPFAEHIEKGSIGKFIGFWSCLSGAVYSFAGVQNVAMLSGEVENPRTNIPKACKRIFYRVTSLYVIAIFCLTLIVPYNDPKIASSSGTASHSPYVVAIERAGVKVLPHIFNAVVLSSAWSEANSDLVSGSRTLYSLASKRQAPKIFLRSSKRKLPYMGLAFVAIFMPLAYMTCDDSAASVFEWFQNLSSSTTLVSWILISINHIRMNKGLKAQGIPRSRLPFHHPLAPTGAWVSLVASIILLLTGGFTIFIKGQWSVSGLFSAYCSPVIFFILYLFWKFFKRTKQIPLKEIDFATLFKDVDDKPEPEPEKLHGWKWITVLWS